MANVSAEPRERILAAALRCFAEGGSRGATTRRIAEAAGVNEVTLFRHFGSKQALLREALGRAARRVPVPALPAEPVDPPRELTAWCRAHLHGLYEARALLRTSWGEFEANPGASAQACEAPLQAARELRTYLARLQESGLADPGVDLETATAMLMGTIFSDAISRDVMPERYPHPLEQSAERYVRLFLRAIAG